MNIKRLVTSIILTGYSVAGAIAQPTAPSPPFHKALNGWTIDGQSVNTSNPPSIEVVATNQAGNQHRFVLDPSIAAVKDAAVWNNDVVIVVGQGSVATIVSTLSLTTDSQKDMILSYDASVSSDGRF